MLLTIAYLNTVIAYEFLLHQTRKRVDLPSSEFIGIKEVIDQVNFDDRQDPIAFGSLIDSHRILLKPVAEESKIVLTPYLIF